MDYFNESFGGDEPKINEKLTKETNSIPIDLLRTLNST